MIFKGSYLYIWVIGGWILREHPLAQWRSKKILSGKKTGLVDPSHGESMTDGPTICLNERIQRVQAIRVFFIQNEVSV